MKRVFVDTGAWYALVDRKDPVHGIAVEFLNSNTIPLVTTNFILDETVTLINKRLGWKIASEVGGRLRDGLSAGLTIVSDKDEDAAWAIFLKYRDSGFSYTDCTSFAVMKRLGLDTAFTFDAHFAVMNFNVVPYRGELARRLCGLGAQLSPERDLIADLDDERDAEDSERAREPQD